MKKILSIVLVMLLMISVLPTGLFSITASAETSGYYTYTILYGKATITYCDTSISGDITIPSTLGGYPVTSIGDDAFKNCKSLTSITIPDSVTSIGEGAFRGCNRLESITLPFVGSSRDVSGTYFAVFGYIFGLTSYYDSSATRQYYSSLSFYYYYYIPSSIKSVTITDDPTIPYGAFYNCTALTSVSLGDSVTSIGENAFYNCTSLTSITIPNSVTSIGCFAFENCSALTSVTIPNSVTSIGDYAFRNCTSLTSITIPDSVTSIGDYAFSGCTSLTSITIGKGVTSLSQSKFGGCNNIEKITVSADNTVYHSKDNCVIETKINKLVLGCKNSIIPNYVVYIGDYAFKNCTCLTSVNIPDSVKIIANYAFYNCTALESVTMTNSVTKFGDYAFNSCDNLSDVYFDGSEDQRYDIVVGIGNEIIEMYATWHYLGCGGDHTYDHGCDTDCNVCGETRTTSHKYSNNCDASCNVCGATRTAPHSYKTSVTKATTSKNGKITKTCSGCKKKVTSTIYYAKSFSLSKTSFTYNGKVQTPTVTVKDAAGKTISSSNYTVTYASGRTNAGTYSVKVTFKGNYSGTKTLTFKINPISYAKCTFKLSTTTYTYNGKVKTPSVTVKDSAGKTLKKNTDYTVSYAKGRKNVGSYKVTIEMKGNYSGTKTLTFKINPPKTTVSKLTAGKKSITVAIAKKSTQVTGYQIQYSTSKKFTNAKTKTISSYKTTKYTLKNLSAKKTYYVRVRTYKTVGKTKYYSGWSTVKSKKTK